jgi:predicted nuclease of predicted toxin-antitoxin system
MRLLFDQNLSSKLCTRIADLFPGAMHLGELGMDRSSDTAIWEYARDNDLVIVSKDSDFNDLAILRGAPPKVVWLQVGNCSTSEVETLLRSHSAPIQAFMADAESLVLGISPDRSIT